MHGTGKTVVLLGDSHAQMLMAPMIEIAKSENWTLAVLVAYGCPWQDGIDRFTDFDKQRCLARKADEANRIILASIPTSSC